MREVTLHWSRHRLVKDRVQIVCQTFEKIVFLGYQERSPRVVKAFMRGLCLDGKTPMDLNNSDDYEVVEILSEPSPHDPAWMFVLNIKHPLTLISAKVGKLTVKPGSCLNQDGIHYTMRGTPLSIKIVTTAARLMMKPDKITAKTIDQEDFKGNQILSDRQTEVLRSAFDAGWYNTPRDISLADLADIVGLGRSTVSEHLIKAESTIIRYFLEGDPSLFEDE